jgi:hypothetical protein
MYPGMNLGTMPKDLRDLRQTGAGSAHEYYALKALMWELRTLWNERDLRSAFT